MHVLLALRQYVFWSNNNLEAVASLGANLYSFAVIFVSSPEPKAHR